MVSAKRDQRLASEGRDSGAPSTMRCSNGARSGIGIHVVVTAEKEYAIGRYAITTNRVNDFLSELRAVGRHLNRASGRPWPGAAKIAGFAEACAAVGGAAYDNASGQSVGHERIPILDIPLAVADAFELLASP